MIELIFMFIMGLALGALLDVFWFNINYSKYEKGFEVFEHYHVGILLGMIGVIFSQPFFLGLFIILFVKESDQTHPFALGSDHFRNSTIIGLVTFICLLCVYIVCQLL